VATDDDDREGTLRRVAARQIDGGGRITDLFVDSTVDPNRGE
jgi:hypothetical protein